MVDDDIRHFCKSVIFHTALFYFEWNGGAWREKMCHGGTNRIAMKSFSEFARMYVMHHHFELQQEDINQFKVLYQKYYGIELNDHHAELLAVHVISFMAFLVTE